MKKVGLIFCLPFTLIGIGFAVAAIGIFVGEYSKNPDISQFVANGYMLPVIVLLGGATVALVVARFIYSFFDDKKELKEVEDLKNNGLKIMAEVDEVTRVDGEDIDGMYIYIITCSYTDPETGEKSVYKSNDFLSKYDVERVMDAHGISYLTVYVDRDDPSKFFLDDAPVQKYINQ